MKKLTLVFTIISLIFCLGVTTNELYGQNGANEVSVQDSAKNTAGSTRMPTVKADKPNMDVERSDGTSTGESINYWTIGGTILAVVVIGYRVSTYFRKK